MKNTTLFFEDGTDQKNRLMGTENPGRIGSAVMVSFDVSCRVSVRER